MIEYYRELLYYLKRNNSNKNDAHDIVQETYEKAISFQHQNKIINKRAFLFRLAKNILIDKVRKSKVQNEIPYDENEILVQNDETEDIVIRQDTQMLIMQELKKLPEKRKEAFVLHIIEGFSKQETAEIMGISYNAVEKHLSRASIDLKEKIERKEN